MAVSTWCCRLHPSMSSMLACNAGPIDAMKSLSRFSYFGSEICSRRTHLERGLLCDQSIDIGVWFPHLLS